MKLYHGSATPGIATLLPNQSNHDKAYVYLTDNETLALLYAHNPMTPPNGFFTYRFSSDGRLHYDEYFDHALETLYTGRRGTVYICECQAKALEKMPWVYISETPVSVVERRDISDLYKELLSRESQGDLIVHRYHTLPDAFKASINQMMRRELTDIREKNPGNEEYRAFIEAHFPHLSD